MRGERVIKFFRGVLVLVCMCILVQTGMVCKAEEKEDWKMELLEDGTAKFRFPSDWHLFVNGQTYDASEYEACGVEESEISSYFESEYVKMVAVQEQTNNSAYIMIMDPQGTETDYKSMSETAMDAYCESFVKGFSRSFSGYTDAEFREYYTSPYARFIVMDIYLKDTDRRLMVVYETVYNGKDVVLCLQGTEDFFQQEAYIESIVDEIHIVDIASVTSIMSLLGYIQGAVICFVVMVVIVVVIVIVCVNAGKKKPKK